MIIFKITIHLPSVVILLSFGITNGFCEREHKVHNIVLYPEKHSWCQTTPIQQVVSSPGYEPVTIGNSVCVGACYSYSIPKTEPAEPGELIGPYCDSCQPSEIKCYHVNLYADNSNIEGPRVLQKRVQIITNCSCQSCDKLRKEDCEISDENTQELPKNMFTDQENHNNKNAPEDFPDLFEAQNNTQHASKHGSENDVNFKNKLKKWFEVYQNETEDNVDNSVKNKDLLEMQQKLEHNEENNLKIVKDLEHLPKSFGVEGAPSHHKGAHIAAGIHRTTTNDVNGDDLTETRHVDHKSETLTGHHPHHVLHKHHHPGGEENHHGHYLGEEQQIGLNVAHLVRGPHGSMALGPVEAKLHIDSDALKPNTEGVVIEYENHQKNTHKVAALLDN